MKIQRGPPCLEEVKTEGWEMIKSSAQQRNQTIQLQAISKDPGQNPMATLAGLWSF
jgi:hypothetical protein